MVVRSTLPFLAALLVGCGGLSLPTLRLPSPAPARDGTRLAAAAEAFYARYRARCEEIGGALADEIVIDTRRIRAGK